MSAVGVITEDSPCRASATAGIPGSPPYVVPENKERFEQKYQKKRNGPSSHELHLKDRQSRTICVPKKSYPRNASAHMIAHASRCSCPLSNNVMNHKHLHSQWQCSRGQDAKGKHYLCFQGSFPHPVLLFHDRIRARFPTMHIHSLSPYISSSVWRKALLPHIEVELISSPVAALPWHDTWASSHTHSDSASSSPFLFHSHPLQHPSHDYARTSGPVCSQSSSPLHHRHCPLRCCHCWNHCHYCPPHSNSPRTP